MIVVIKNYPIGPPRVAKKNNAETYLRAVQRAKYTLSINLSIIHKKSETKFCFSCISRKVI